MAEQKIGVVESRFADIIWANEPIKSRKLAEICAAKLQWKRPTTYNVLRKLCGKGIFQNINGTVSSVLSREEFYAMQGETVVDEGFEGSLPAFIAAFTAHRKMSDEQIEELIAEIRSRKEKENGVE